jgi:hypothetical protein
VQFGLLYKGQQVSLPVLVPVSALGPNEGRAPDTLLLLADAS